MRDNDKIKNENYGDSDNHSNVYIIYLFTDTN